MVVGMDWFLVEHESGLAVEVQVDGALRSSLKSQLDRLKSEESREAFAKRLSRHVSEGLAGALDWDLKEPTKAQVAFAKSLSRRLDCHIPQSAYLSRAAMHGFIEAMSLELKRRG